MRLLHRELEVQLGEVGPHLQTLRVEMHLWWLDANVVNNVIVDLRAREICETITLSVFR